MYHVRHNLASVHIHNKVNHTVSLGNLLINIEINLNQQILNRLDRSDQTTSSQVGMILRLGQVAADRSISPNS